MMATHRQLLTACLLALVATASGADTGLSCEGLKTVPLPDTRLVALTKILPTPVWSIDMPAFGQVRRISVNRPLCRVEGVIEREIGFELWLPAKTDWNRRFLGVGSGGSAGYINYSELARGLARGFASASTDSGHKSTDNAWMLGNPDRIRNYSDRAHHLLAQIAKRIVAAYYGQDSRRAYFIGCSGGGRQGLKEMQRFPEDYDGIVAGAPGPDMPVMTVRHLITGLMQSNHPESRLSDNDWRLVADAAIAACDANDGVRDGVIENPEACSFDPKTLLCKNTGDKDCLSLGQLELVRQISAPIQDEAGRQIDSGLLPGVRTRLGPPPDLVTEFFAHGVYQNRNWNPASFNIVRDLAAARKAIPEIWADDPDLKEFRSRGGKAIIYSGWMDPSVIAEQALNYYRRVVATIGGVEATGSFLRLYMAPGVFHCSGGPGPDRFGGAGGDALSVDADHDMLSAMVDWVEKGKAPERIIASRINDGKVTRTRPLCPYPQVARYTGTGSTDAAENFNCGAP
jgi:feruloyl esterase